jgi:hypothetical protein
MSAVRLLPTTRLLGAQVRWVAGVGRQHLCSVCNRWYVWSRASGWFGSYRELDDAAPVVKWCSTSCAKKLALKGFHEAAEAYAAGSIDAE